MHPPKPRSLDQCNHRQLGIPIDAYRVLQGGDIK